MGWLTSSLRKGRSMLNTTWNILEQGVGQDDDDDDNDMLAVPGGVEDM